MNTSGTIPKAYALPRLEKELDSSIVCCMIRNRSVTKYCLANVASTMLSFPSTRSALDEAMETKAFAAASRISFFGWRNDSDVALSQSCTMSCLLGLKNSDGEVDEDGKVATRPKLSITLHTAPRIISPPLPRYKRFASISDTRFHAFLSVSMLFAFSFRKYSMTLFESKSCATPSVAPCRFGKSMSTLILKSFGSATVLVHSTSVSPNAPSVSTAKHLVDSSQCSIFTSNMCASMAGRKAGND